MPKRNILTFSSHWLQTGAAADPRGPRLHDKTVKKAFHQLKKRAVWTLRLYYAAIINFANKGFFHINDMMTVLGGYGYGTSREARRVALETLQKAPGWFTETRPGYFTFKSTRRVIGFKRGNGNEYRFDESLLHKKNAQAFTDILLNVNASGQTIAADNLVNQTGYHRARLFDAFRRGLRYGFQRFKVLVPVPGMDYTARLDAINAAGREYWDKGQIAEVIRVNGKYTVFLIVGLCFQNLSDMVSDGDGVQVALNNNVSLRAMPSRDQAKHRQTTVFDADLLHLYTGQDAVTGQTTRFIMADFISIAQGDNFLSKHKAIKRVYAAA